MVETQYNEILFFSSLLAFSEFVNPTKDEEDPADPADSAGGPAKTAISAESKSSPVGLTNSVFALCSPSLFEFPLRSLRRSH